jgi:hypothetical protein
MPSFVKLGQMIQTLKTEPRQSGDHARLAFLKKGKWAKNITVY